MQKRNKERKKRNPWKIALTVFLCSIVLLGALYQGYRVIRDYFLEKVFVYMLDDNQKTEKANDNNTDGERMSVHEVAEAFERLNGAEPEEGGDSGSDKNKTYISNEQMAKDIVSRIPEADKNRAIAIVSSVASVDDCFALYELAVNGDEQAKAQLKAIYARFTPAQTDELWALYEKNKHLIE